MRGCLRWETVSLLFEAHDEPITARPDYWQTVVGEMLCPLELRIRNARDVPDSLLVDDAGAVRVAELTAGRTGSAARTQAHVRRADPELYKIDVQAQGYGVVEQGDRQACLAPGDFTFVDLSRPARWTNAPCRMVAVMFPRALLPLPRGDLARLTGAQMRGDTGAGALVSALACQLPQRLGDCDGATRARLGSAVLDLLATALATQLGRPEQVPADSRRRALLLEVRAFIDRHLGDPRLTPGSVAAAHYISVRSLHKLFEAEQTTVADWIRRRRLEACRRDLRDPLLREQPVHAIAARHGLGDPAHFSRAFRRAYDLTPGEYRRLALGDPA